MSRADEYRKLAAEFRAKAKQGGSSDLGSQLDELARHYVRLAEAADRNDTTDIVLEPPPPKLSDYPGGD